MIYELELNENVLLCDAMDIISKLGSFVFADMRLYIHSEKNILRSKKINDIAKNINCLSYDACSKLPNNMVRQFCIDKLYEERLKEMERSPEGQKKIMTVLNFINEMQELTTKGAIEVANKEEDEGSAS